MVLRMTVALFAASLALVKFSMAETTKHPAVPITKSQLVTPSPTPTATPTAINTFAVWYYER